jgi:hypothetical protein
MDRSQRKSAFEFPDAEKEGAEFEKERKGGDERRRRL